MKLISTFLALTFATSVLAADFCNDQTAITHLARISEDQKQIALLVDASQEFFHSGEISPLLNQQIKVLQDINSDLSVEDAVDLILNISQK